MSTGSPASESFNVLITGGGVAALEATLALSDLAGDRVAITLLAPEPDFIVRPTALTEAFGYGSVLRVPVAEVAADAGAAVIADAFAWLDSRRSLVHTESHVAVPYDAVLLALGARARPAFRHAVTLDDTRISDQVDALLEEIDDGRVRTLALVIPWPMPWPLPVYELALMTAKHARATGHPLRIEIITPEDAPLALFGAEASHAVSDALDHFGIAVHTSAQCGVPDPGLVFIHPGPQMLRADRIVALPQLFGPPSPGIPGGVHNGFLAVDPFCRVRGVPRVFAAGDATDFPVKHGSIAAQQAETAARSIAAMAGADVEPRRFEPVITAVLVGGEWPLHLRAEVSGMHGVRSEAYEEHVRPTSTPKIAAKYLNPYLDAKLGVGAKP